MSTFAGGLAAACALAHALDRDPREHTGSISSCSEPRPSRRPRTIARDEVTSFLRDPFVEGEARDGGEEPVDTGDLRQAIGELVTCSRCVGTWVAAGLGCAQILAPCFGRLLIWTLSAAP